MCKFTLARAAIKICSHSSSTTLYAGSVYLFISLLFLPSSSLICVFWAELSYKLSAACLPASLRVHYTCSFEQQCCSCQHDQRSDRLWLALCRRERNSVTFHYSYPSRVATSFLFVDVVVLLLLLRCCCTTACSSLLPDALGVVCAYQCASSSNEAFRVLTMCFTCFLYVWWAEGIPFSFPSPSQFWCALKCTEKSALIR